MYFLSVNYTQRKYTHGDVHTCVYIGVCVYIYIYEEMERWMKMSLFFLKYPTFAIV